MSIALMSVMKIIHGGGHVGQIIFTVYEKYELKYNIQSIVKHQ